MAISTVVGDLEAEGLSQVQSVAVLSSLSVTKPQLQSRLKSLFGSDEDDETTVLGKENGLVVAISNSPKSDVSTVMACSGSLVFLVDQEDVMRGEGLMEVLAPAVEEVSISQCIVVVPDGIDLDVAKGKLEQAAAITGTTLPSDIDFVSEGEAKSKLEPALLKTTPQVAATEASTAINQAVISSRSFGSASTSSLDPQSLRATRILVPVFAKQLEDTVTSVRNMASSKDDPLLLKFGQVCQAAIDQALENVEAEISTRGLGSSASKDMKEYLREQLYGSLLDVYESHIGELRQAYFTLFKEDLSKLRLSPFLGDEIAKIVKESIKAFGKAVVKLHPKQQKMGWPIPSTASASFAKELKEFAAERLLIARASGKFRPVPRKGFGVGLHWLLPKPFGSDFRQEPWERHTKEGLVYVPDDKVTDVPLEDIESGDWRKKVVPSPGGNEMIYYSG